MFAYDVDMPLTRLELLRAADTPPSETSGRSALASAVSPAQSGFVSVMRSIATLQAAKDAVLGISDSLAGMRAAEAVDTVHDLVTTVNDNRVLDSVTAEQKPDSPAPDLVDEDTPHNNVTMSKVGAFYAATLAVELSIVMAVSWPELLVQFGAIIGGGAASGELYRIIEGVIAHLLRHRN